MIVSELISFESLLVFLLQGLLQVLDRAGDWDRREGVWMTQSLELLLHVYVLTLFLLSDGCHLLDLLLGCLQRLGRGKNTK